MIILVSGSVWFAALITGILGMGGPGSAWSVHRIVIIAIVLQTTGGERERNDRGGEGEGCVTRKRGTRRKEVGNIATGKNNRDRGPQRIFRGILLT
jgi:hypothetical protein